MSNIIPASPHRNLRSPFDAIRRFRADDSEFWTGRDAMRLLGYSKWQNMENAIRKAKAACKNSGQSVKEHFTDISKTPTQGGPRQQDTEMTRYAMYLVAMNSDPEKKEVADAQTYFAVQTFRAETQLPPVQQPTNPTLLPYTNRVVLAWRIRGAVPDGYWCVFCEGADVLQYAEHVFLPAGLEMQAYDLLDGSIGTHWSKFREEKSWCGNRVRYPHQFPEGDPRGKQPAWAYPMQEIQHFKDWLHRTYLPAHFPDYLQRKYGACRLRLAAPILRRLGINIAVPALVR